MEIVAGVITKVDEKWRLISHVVVVNDKSGGGGQQIVPDVVDVRVLGGMPTKPFSIMGRPADAGLCSGGGGPKSAA